MSRVVLLVFLAACGTSEAPAPEPTTTPEPVVESGIEYESETQRAARIAAAIRAEPSRTEAILDEEGLEPSVFEAMLYDIARDPEEAAAYRAALEQ